MQTHDADTQTAGIDTQHGDRHKEQATDHNKNKHVHIQQKTENRLTDKRHRQQSQAHITDNSEQTITTEHSHRLQTINKRK